MPLMTQNDSSLPVTRYSLPDNCRSVYVT